MRGYLLENAETYYLPPQMIKFGNFVFIFGINDSDLGRRGHKNSKLTLQKKGQIFTFVSALRWKILKKHGKLIALPTLDNYIRAKDSSLLHSSHLHKSMRKT